MIAKETHRKYANAKTFYAIKDGKIKGIFPLEWKMTQKDLKSFLAEIKELADADEIILHWDARRGIVDEKVGI